MDEGVNMGLWTNTVERILHRYVDKTDSCWLWTGCMTSGYGLVNMNGRLQPAHRVIYEAFNGPISDGMVLDHICRRHSCVNPLHLEQVTKRENTLRGISPAAEHAKKTHCKYGHPLSGDNLREFNGRYGPCRVCKTCARERSRKFKAKAKK